MGADVEVRNTRRVLKELNHERRQAVRILLYERWSAQNAIRTRDQRMRRLKVAIRAKHCERGG